MLLKKDQVETILRNAPAGVDKKKLLDGLIQKGYELEGVDTAAARARLTPSAPAQTPQGGGYVAGVADAAKAGADKVGAGVAQIGSGSVLGAAEGALKVGAGAVETVTSPLAPLFSPVGKLIGWVSDKISDNKAVQDFALSDAGKTTARVAENVANASTIAGAVAGGIAAPKAASAVAGTLTKGSEHLAGIVNTGAKGITEATAKAADPANIMQRVARLTPTQQNDFKQMTGEAVGEYLVNRGIFGDVDEITPQLAKRFNESRNSVDKALASLPGEFKSTTVGNALKQLSDRERRVSSPGALSRDLERVNALQKKHNGAGLTMEEINEVKRLYEKNVKLEYAKENVPDKVQMANNVDSALRTWQFAQAQKLGFKNLPELNKETQAARQLLDDLGAKYGGAAGNNAVTLTDWIILAGGDPTAVAGFITKKAFSSKKVMSALAKRLSPGAVKGAPKAQFGAPTIDSYLNFIRATEGRATQQ